jgi:hypothetical protein
VSDSEGITCASLSELWLKGDEERFCHFLSQFMRPLFPRQLDRSQFSRRRRALSGVIILMRRLWREQLPPQDEKVRSLDGAPIPVCTFARSNRRQTVRGVECCGRLESKKGKLFGFRLHATVTPDQLMDERVLAPTTIHDVHVALELLSDDSEIIAIGDTAYTSAELEQTLWDDAMIQLLPLRHPGQHLQWTADVRRLLSRIRMRVETAFSQLTTVFDFGPTGARSLVGAVNRVVSKMLAHTFCFLWHRVNTTADWSGSVTL